MTPEERKIYNDAQEQSLQFASEEPETSGIRPPPKIEVSEQTLDGEIFGFDFAGQPFSTAEPGASTPPAGFACPSNLPDTMIVEFSGINVDCGCFDLSPKYAYQAITATDIAVNGVPITITHSGFPPWFGTDAVSYHLDLWFNDVPEELCDGDPDTSGDHNPIAYLWCSSDGSGIHVFYLDGEALFYGTVTELGVPANNELECSDILFIPPDQTTISDFFGTSYPSDARPVIGNGGTVIITAAP